MSQQKRTFEIIGHIEEKNFTYVHGTGTFTSCAFTKYESPVEVESTTYSLMRNVTVPILQIFTEITKKKTWIWFGKEKEVPYRYTQNVRKKFDIVTFDNNSKKQYVIKQL